MNAIEFYNEFIAAVKEQKIWAECGENYITIFRNEPDRFGQILCNGVIPQILRKNGLTLPRKPSADVVGRLARCEEMEDADAAALGLKLSLWDMQFAAEYESDGSLWINRLIKLVHLYCPLKVLIAFSDNREKDSERLRFAARCMKRIAAYEHNSREEYLVILGNASPAENFGWKPYVYDHNDRCFYPLIEDDAPQRHSQPQLERFVTIQKNMYPRALREVRQGRKKSHWMWYIFPQYKGLGHSSMSEFFSIQSLEEARAYFQHPVLGSRLMEITEALLASKALSPEDIFGGIDSIKLRSSMTLFERAAPECPLFGMVLDKFFKGKRDPKTLELLESDS